LQVLVRQNSARQHEEADPEDEERNEGKKEVIERERS
jgi:hypothetical protein